MSATEFHQTGTDQRGGFVPRPPSSPSSTSGKRSRETSAQRPRTGSARHSAKRQQQRVKDYNDFQRDRLENRDARSLEHWEKTVRRWQRQQEHLAKSVGIEPASLNMQSHESLRPVKEIRELVENALPSVGNHATMSEEFWSLYRPTRQGLVPRLPADRRRRPDDLTFAERPSSVIKEMGVPNSRLRPGFKRPGGYLEERTSDLESALHQVMPQWPSISDLEVVGRGVMSSEKSIDQTMGGRGSDPVHIAVEDWHSARASRDESRDHQADADSQPDQRDNNTEDDSMTASEEEAGPAWTVSTTVIEQDSDEARPLDAGEQVANAGGDTRRLTLRSQTRGTARTDINVTNTGSTVLLFRWIKQLDTASVRQRRDPTPRFFFDTRQGSILPGESKQFRVVFSSDLPGLFTERWTFQILPQSDAQQSIKFVFDGIARQSDPFAQFRRHVEESLEHRAGETLARRIVKEMITSVPRAAEELRRQRVKSHVIPQSRAEKFVRLNPGVCNTTSYSEDVEAELHAFFRRLWDMSREQIAAEHPAPAAPVKSAKGKKVHDETKPATPVPSWDRRVATLFQMVQELEPLEKQEKLLDELYDVLNSFQEADQSMRRTLEECRFDIARHHVTYLLDDVSRAGHQLKLELGIIVPDAPPAQLDAKGAGTKKGDGRKSVTPKARDRDASGKRSGRRAPSSGRGKPGSALGADGDNKDGEHDAKLDPLVTASPETKQMFSKRLQGRVRELVRHCVLDLTRQCHNAEPTAEASADEDAVFLELL